MTITMMYGRQTRNAIAIMSRLAETYEMGVMLSAASIAEARELSPTTVAKALSMLSKEGLVKSSPGPRGGFLMARPPGDVTIHEVFRIFEREEERQRVCPFGGGICGDDGEECPLHSRLAKVNAAMDELLHDTTFEIFRET